MRLQATSTCIEAPAVGRRLVSAITPAELETMIANAQQPDRKFTKVRLILAHFNLVDFGENAALYADRMRAYLEPHGVAIGPLDTLIAARTRCVGATVVTDNARGFERVPELKVENWLR